MRIATFLLSVFFGFTSFGQLTIDSLEQELRDAFNKSSLKGLGVAIVDSSGLLYGSGFGYADISSERPYTIHTLQPIGSISKTLLGVSIMKAQELGLLTLDDDVNEYLPFELKNPNAPGETIRIRHLATHTAGIKDSRHYEKAYVFSNEIDVSQLQHLKKYARIYNSNQRLSLQEFLENIYHPAGVWYSKSHFLNFKPGERYEYSNNGAALASMIIAKASGISYTTFVEKYVLNPLDMQKSGWSMLQAPVREKASLYVGDYALPDYELITYADGGFVTSINEFSIYFSEMIRGHLEGKSVLLKPQSFKEMFTTQYDSDESLGYFWVAGKKRIGHTGGDPGLITIAYFNRSDGLGVVLFTNTNHTKSSGDEMGNLFRILDSYAHKL